MNTGRFLRSLSDPMLVLYPGGSGWDALFDDGGEKFLFSLFRLDPNLLGAADLACFHQLITGGYRSVLVADDLDLFASGSLIPLLEAEERLNRLITWLTGIESFRQALVVGGCELIGAVLDEARGEVVRVTWLRGTDLCSPN